MDAPQPAPGPRRRWPRAVLYGGAAGLLLGLVAEAARVLVGANCHAVIPGQVYRSAQLAPGDLEALIHRRGIRTVVNLRGCCSALEWYQDECRVTHRCGVAQEDVSFSAGRMPSPREVRRLVEVLDRSAYPMVLHCARGADRTGLAAAVALLLADRTLAEARRQLGPRYGHLPLGRPTYLDRFLDRYAAWLAGQGREHSAAAFRHWLEEEYCPDECRADLALVDAPAWVPAGRPFALRLRARNTSVQTWRLHPCATAGVHAQFLLCDEQGGNAGLGRAGLYDAEVPPGDMVELTLALPPLAAGRYRLLVDMISEQHCCFYQAGSEPLEEELIVREQEAAGGGQPGAVGAAGVVDGLATGR